MRVRISSESTKFSIWLNPLPPYHAPPRYAPVNSRHKGPGKHAALNLRGAKHIFKDIQGRKQPLSWGEHEKFFAAKLPPSIMLFVYLALFRWRQFRPRKFPAAKRLTISFFLIFFYYSVPPQILFTLRPCRAFLC